MGAAAGVMGLCGSSAKDKRPGNSGEFAAEWYGVLGSNLELVVDNERGDLPLKEYLEGKLAVCIYFSASWCPPCRQFTPVLAKWYKKAEAAGIAVIFATRDRDEESFSAYHDTMGFPALAWSERSRIEKLGKDYEVKGIPDLVVLNGNTT